MSREIETETETESNVLSGSKKVFAGNAGEIRVLRGIVRALRKELPNESTERLLKIASAIVEEIELVGREAQQEKQESKPAVLVDTHEGDRGDTDGTY